MHWLSHWLGLDNVAGAVYAWWSGSGSVVLPWLLNALTFAGLFWWHHQCSVHGCWWYARRTTAAGEKACWLHHPNRKRTVEDVHAAHHERLAALTGQPRKRQQHLTGGGNH